MTSLRVHTSALLPRRWIVPNVRRTRSHHAAAPPNFRDVTQIEVVLVVLGVAQWRRFRVDRMLLLAHIGIAQNAQTFGVGGHEAVLDTVVDHLDEVTGTVRTQCR
jgi:hypothetical protein